MKTCTICKKDKPLKSYYKKNKTTLRSDCKECHKTIMLSRSRKHFKENPEYYRQRNIKKRKEISALVRSLKENKTCIDCKLPHPYWRLDFDHLGDKSFNIYQATFHTKEKVLKEIAKCELVCANCHRDRTQKRISTLSDLNR